MSFLGASTFSRYRLPNPGAPQADPDDPKGDFDDTDDAEANPDAPEADFDDPDDPEADFDAPDDAEANPDAPEDAEANPDAPEADFDDAEANPGDPEAGAVPPPVADHLLSNDGLLADGTLTRMTGSPCAGPDDSGEVFFDRSTFTMVGAAAGAPGFWVLFGRLERDPPLSPEEEEPLYFGPSQAGL